MIGRLAFLNVVGTIPVGDIDSGISQDILELLQEHYPDAEFTVTTVGSTGYRMTASNVEES